MSITNTKHYTGTDAIQEFVTSIPGEPEWLGSFRQDAVQAFQNSAWPDSSADEEWRRSDLSFLEFGKLSYELPFMPSQAIETAESGSAAASTAMAELAGPAVPLQDLSAYVAYMNGELVLRAVDPEAAENGLGVYSLDDIRRGVFPESLTGALESALRTSLDAADSRPQYWHYALMDSLTVVVVPEFLELDKPVLVDQLFSGDDMIRSPHIVVLTKDGGRLRIIERFRSSSPDDAVLVTHGIDGNSAPSAAVDYFLVQDLNFESTVLRFGRLDVYQSSRMHHFEAHFGADFVKGRIEADMQSSGTDVVLNGIYFGSEEQHFDMRTVQRHIGRNASSQTFYKGAVRDEAHTVYQGLIEVKPGAALTDAYLTNNNLVLNSGAFSESIPTLEIKNNDVKCSHGSTTGKIEPSYIFYLMSRGFDPVEAKALLVEGFFAEVSVQAPGFVQNQLNALVMDRLQKEYN
ncbi:SufB/SufD family protein [Spirochaeta dissipatitropha]